MWLLIYQIKLFQVLKLAHALIYNAHNLQLLLLQLNKPTTIIAIIVTINQTILSWHSTLDLNVLRNALNNLQPTIKFTAEPAKLIIGQ